MARTSRFSGFAALALAAAALVAGVPQSAAASTGTSDPAAVAAVNGYLGSPKGDDAVLSATYSPDHTHIAYRQGFDQPQSSGDADIDGSDAWVMRADGSAKWQLTTTSLHQISPSSPVTVSDPIWAPDSSGLAYYVIGPGHMSNVATRVFTATATGDDWSGSQDHPDADPPSGLAYTSDSHYLVYRLSNGGPTALDYAIDRSTSTRYLARTVRTDPTTKAVTTTWSDACATVTEGAYTLVPHPENPALEIRDALEGPTPACKFGLPTDPDAPTGTTPIAGGGSHAASTPDETAQSTTTPTPALNDSPGATQTANPNLTPISEHISAIPGPTLKITDIGTGLAAARKSGLHVKFTVDRLVKLKVWVVLTGSGARYSTDEAFAGVPATTIARASIDSAKAGNGSLYAKFDKDGKSKLTGVSRLTLQVKITATDVAGRSTTAVQNVKLRR